MHREGQSEFKVPLEIAGGLQVAGVRGMKAGWLHKSLPREAELFTRL